MQILFTGSSSFTGFWFIKELVEQGHKVFATFQSAEDSYTGMRAQRVEKIKTFVLHFSMPLLVHQIFKN